MRGVRADLPLHLTAADYADAKATLERLCATVGVGLDRIGYFGQVSHPGISDLDAMVIARPGQLAELATAIEAARSSDPVLAAVLWHPPVYLLEELVPVARELHTFAGLRGGAADLLPPEQASPPTVLERCWFTFLCRVYADLLLRSTVSLRTLLLVHRDLEISLHRLSRQAGVTLEPSSTSIQLRRDVIAGEADPVTAFTTLFGDVAELFDLACAAGGPTRRSLRAASVLLRRRIPLRRARSTRVRRLPGMVLLEANAWACEVALAYQLGRARGDAADYLAATYQAEASYGRHGLPYPFVRPFGLSHAQSAPAL